MRWLKRLFGWVSPPCVAYSEDDLSEFLTYEEAKELAESQAKRDLQVSDKFIRYVTFENNFQDFCRIEIQFAEPNTGSDDVDDVASRRTRKR